MKKNTAILLLLFLATFSSCDNELNVNADYKEIIVVYGLLDYTQPEQFIKINKAFLSKDNSAYIDAQRSDSLYLDSVEAKLIDNFGTEFPLTKTNVANKEDGVFSNEVNILYTTTAKLSPLNAYHLEVKNPITENLVTSYTKLVGKARVMSPVATNQLKWVIRPNLNIKFQFISGKNAILYDLKVLFTYEEIQKSDTNVRDTNTIEWFVLKNRILDNAKGGNLVNLNVDSDLFFDFIASKIEEKPEVFRRALTGDILIYGGGEEINTYISVSRPSIGIVQKTEDYSNINNGRGIFSSRNITAVRDIQFSPTTLSNLRIGSKTQGLNFIN
jgi:hypothetical protein